MMNKLKHDFCYAMSRIVHIEYCVITRIRHFNRKPHFVNRESMLRRRFLYYSDRVWDYLMIERERTKKKKMRFSNKPLDIYRRFSFFAFFKKFLPRKNYRGCNREEDDYVFYILCGGAE